MGSTPAEIAFQRLADVLLGRLRLLCKERNGADDHAASTVAALRHLLLDEGGLHRVRRGDRAEPFERNDRLARRTRNRLQAGSRGTAVKENVTDAALAETAAELRGRESEPAQRLEQRLIGI